MNSRALILMISFIIILLSPIFAKVSASPAITPEEARLFIEEYVNRFMRLDLKSLMELFSRNAVENRVLPYADIEEAYRRTIERTQALHYKIHLYSIDPLNDEAFVRGRYQIIQFLKRKSREIRFGGEIQFRLIREGNSLKIREVNYGRDR